jgi:hypothetical protein
MGERRRGPTEDTEERETTKYTKDTKTEEGGSADFV